MNTFALVPEVSCIGQTVAHKISSVFISQLVYRQESDVMPGKLILGSYISQTCNQIFHYHSLFKLSEVRLYENNLRRRPDNKHLFLLVFMVLVVSYEIYSGTFPYKEAKLQKFLLSLPVDIDAQL
jgi:hypothetical protein